MADSFAEASSSIPRNSRWVYVGLIIICAIYVAICCTGITWGLPSRKIDKYLFGEGEVWSGQKIHRLANAAEKLSEENLKKTGADVDVDAISAERGVRPAPLPSPQKEDGEPPESATVVALTTTEEDVAKIYLRYRLYTYQPDEMITMMALAGMRPRQLQFDPRLYQYGGLFIYPVGALIKFAGLLGLIDVRSDLIFYLDNPDEFGKFYIVARAYSAAWGLLGVVVVFALTRRIALAIQTPSESERPLPAQASQISGRMATASAAGVIGALFFAFMPVVVCMSHEGKPHLPGAVLMLLSVYVAILTIDNRKFFWLVCVCCGAAVGMVLSSWPICVLIPLTAFLEYRRSKIEGRKRESARAFLCATLGLLVAVGVYFGTNPYVLINFFTNREVLRSNFGNSLAMYELARVGEGFVRVVELTIEGASAPVFILGFLALVFGVTSRPRKSAAVWLLVIPAFLFFAQFVLIGAGKPPEYGRFAIFTNAALIIGTALVLCARWAGGALGVVVLCVVLLWNSFAALEYVDAFRRDAAQMTSRMLGGQAVSEALSNFERLVVVPVEPAPYSCPPMNFAKTRVLLANEAGLKQITEPSVLVHIDDRIQPAKIAWAGKRVAVRTYDRETWLLEIDSD